MSVSEKVPDHVLESELHKAYRTAKAVHSRFHIERPTSLDDRFAMDMCGVVVEAIDAIECHKQMPSTWYYRLSQYVSADSRIPLLQLGYTLAVLIEKLMTERITGFPINTIQESSVSAVSQYSNAVEERPVFDVVADFKEEPVDIKEEPIDDYPEIKQEPIVDVYYPNTGDARPIDQSDAFFDEVVDEKFLADEQRREVPLSQFPISKFPMDGGEKVFLNGKEIRYAISYPSSSSHTSTTTEFAPKNQSRKERMRSVRVEKCFLCGQSTAEFMSTADYKDCRKDFLARIIVKTQSERARMVALGASREQAFFCPTHFINTIRPIVAESEKADFIEAQICDLCDDPEMPCRESPINRTSAQRFFAGVDVRTTEQEEKIEWFLNTNQRALICMKHFQREKFEKPRPRYDAVSSTLNLVKNRELRKNGTSQIEVFSKKDFDEINSQPKRKRLPPIDVADVDISKPDRPMWRIKSSSTEKASSSKAT